MHCKLLAILSRAEYHKWRSLDSSSEELARLRGVWLLSHKSDRATLLGNTNNHHFSVCYCKLSAAIAAPHGCSLRDFLTKNYMQHSHDWCFMLQFDHLTMNSVILQTESFLNECMNSEGRSRIHFSLSYSQVEPSARTFPPTKYGDIFTISRFQYYHHNQQDSILVVLV